VGAGGEMTQALYALMNNKRKKCYVFIKNGPGAYSTTTKKKKKE
jgi:hypothetical protein